MDAWQEDWVYKILDITVVHKILPHSVESLVNNNLNLIFLSEMVMKQRLTSTVLA